MYHETLAVFNKQEPPVTRQLPSISDIDKRRSKSSRTILNRKEHICLELIFFLQMFHTLNSFSIDSQQNATENTFFPPEPEGRGLGRGACGSGLLPSPLL